MAGLAQNAHNDFWRAPIQTAPETVHSDMVEACDRCGTEFIVGSRYCHNCGATRPEATDSAATVEFTKFGRVLGLPTGALIAFVIGVICLLGALAVGYIFSAKTILDWQAVQLWRIEWLLGAVAAFVAGCLLKTSR